MTQNPDDSGREARIEKLEEQVKKLTGQLTETREALQVAREKANRAEKRASEAEARAERAEARAEELAEELSDTQDNIAKNVRTAAEGRKDLKNRVAELQERELLKDAHLSVDNLNPQDVSQETEKRLGKVSKEEGTFWYLGTEPGTDPTEANETAKADPRLSTADLLPIQQLASMDEETLDRHAGTVADYWAAQMWQERGEKDSLWKQGSGSVKEYLDASDVATRIYVESDGISRDSAREYARRAFRSLVELSANRTYTTKASKRSDGLDYKETRLILPTDAEVPGEPRAAAEATQSLGRHVEGEQQSVTDAPETEVVAGE